MPRPGCSNDTLVNEGAERGAVWSWIVAGSYPMSDNSLFDMFDLSKTDEMLRERARAESQLKD